MNPAEAMTEAILSREWWDHEKAAHELHRYDGGCAVCQGWVEAMVGEGLRALDMAGLVVVPLEAYDRLVKVAAYVSRGRGFVGVEPYPDATARMALGALPERTQSDG